MRIVPHQVPTPRGWFLGVRESAAFVKGPDQEDGLDAARGIIIALFISILFWIGIFFVL